MKNDINKTHVITVATHTEGNLNNLIHNKQHIPIKVLGYGQKWEGFKMKFRLIYEYLLDLPDDDIIIYLDGFDSDVVLSLDIAVDKFKKSNAFILFSKDIKDIHVFHEVITPFFKRCNHNYLNAGMFMGYAYYVKMLFKKALQDPCKDDQVVLSHLFEEEHSIQIDDNNEIFQNIQKISDYNKKAVFISTPGKMTPNRVYRALFEYSQFFIIPILVSYIIIGYFILNNSVLHENTNRVLFSLLTLFVFILFVKMDHSCVKKYGFSGYETNDMKYILPTLPTPHTSRC